MRHIDKDNIKKNTIKLKSLLILLVFSVSVFLTACDQLDVAKDIIDSSTTEQSTETINTTGNNVKIHFIDTGNSDAILIQDNGVFTLIDGGDNDDEGLMVDYLNKHGVKSIKYLISTHAHADHLGGLDAIVENFKVENALVSNGSASTKSYRDFIYAMSDKGLSPGVPLEDKKFYLNKSYFEVLNTNGGDTTNNQSLVLVYTNGNDKVLLTGDIEKETEREILDKVGKVDLLKIAHHGSRSSTSQAFLDKVNPEYAVIFAGEGNSYGHPHKEIMNRLKNMGIELYRSDESGDIIFDSTGNGLTTNAQPGSYIDGRSK